MQIENDRTAFDNLRDEFGLDISAIPDRQLIDMGFERLCEGRGMSLESQTLILYRIVAMQLAATLKILVESGEATASDDNVAGIMALLKASFDWSAAADDNARAESIAENLTSTLRKTLQELGVFHDADVEEDINFLEDQARTRSSNEVLADVQRCVRHASREKVKFRLSRLQGFLEKLRRESKIRQWGLDLERSYEREVTNSPQLWDLSEPDDYKNLEYLWQKFGLGDAHLSEAVYDDTVALDVIFTWVLTLYPDCAITSGELADRLRKRQIRNTRTLEGGYATGRRFIMPLPIDQLVRELAEELGPYS